MHASTNTIEIYQTADGQLQIEVQFEKDTVWLSQDQMVVLFHRDQSAISRHIKNIFTEGELDQKSNMQKMHIAFSDKPVTLYSLDVIISVGYRVKSQQGTQFRQWATQKLKEYLVQGYTINQKRLEQLQKIVEVVQRSGNSEYLQLGEAKGLLEILSNYTHSFILLNQYDSHNLKTDILNEHISYEIQYDEAVAAIIELKRQLMAKKEATELFGNQKDASFQGILGNVVKASEANISILALKNRLPICCILSSKIIRSRMGTNELAHFYSFGFWKKIGTVSKKTEKSKSMTMDWWHWLYW